VTVPLSVTPVGLANEVRPVETTGVDAEARYWKERMTVVAGA
jgi:hypothetical protein